MRFDMRRSLARDLRAIGNAQRWASWLQFLLVTIVLLPAYVADHQLWVLVVLLTSLTIGALAFRVRAWIDHRVLCVRGHLRTHHVVLDDLETFVALTYAGAWTGGVSADWFLLYQLDAEYRGFARSQSLPATMCTRARAIRLEAALNAMLPKGTGSMVGA
ncbi:hypothetical protein [Microbacterium sp. E-13]|uniref:hypothetical protein n=1 Tax=Microbacterium sp. E-13 TaxID=3404048 RepID=UPI003CF2A27B